MVDLLQIKSIILEIINQLDGVTGRKKIDNVYYHACLHYYRNNPGFLSSWPIIALEFGPGIDRLENLIGSMLIDGYLELNARNIVVKKEIGVTDAEKASIACALYKVNDIIYSRSWKNAELKEELNFYSDILSDEEYNKRQKEFKSLVGDFFDAKVSR